MLALICLTLTIPPAVLIENGTVFDGTGANGRVADVRIANGQIREIGSLKAVAGETVIDARGLYVTPGFIDAHSHADGNLDKLESQIRQGITTAVAGQDGSRSSPVAEQMKRANGSMINFAFFSGHGGLRQAVMGAKHERMAMPSEVRRMQSLLAEDMGDGALGLSTGLEYNPGFYASRAELVDLMRTADDQGGMYISHVRDETAGVFDSFREVFDIARKSGRPAQVSHIKMGVASVWGKAGEAVQLIEEQRRAGLDVTADVYPYLYWQSTIRVLTNSREWEKRQVWVDALRDVGGPGNVRLTVYSPDPSWAGKTLQELEKTSGKAAPDLIMHIIEQTADGKGRESVLVTAMTEPDLITFLRQPWIMFCSDGSGGGSHPRGAGSFPRILSRYVRDLKVLSWQEAIRKMTSFPASKFQLSHRGLLKTGYHADVLVFDPARIQDKANPDNPTAMSEGIVHALVNGVFVLQNGSMLDAKPGLAVRRGE